MFGRSASEDDYIGLHARSQRVAGDPAEPDGARPVQCGISDHIPGAEELGDAGFARELQVEERRVLEGNRRPHLGKDVAWGHPFRVDPQPGADPAIDQLLDLQGLQAGRHLARRGEDDPRSGAGYGIQIGITEVEAVDQGDISPSMGAIWLMSAGAAPIPA